MLFDFFKKKKLNHIAETSVFDTIKSEFNQESRNLVPVNLNAINRRKPTADVTVMINVWKRTHLQEQLFHLLTQTVFPKEIWILHYENHVDITDVISTYQKYFGFIHLIRSDKNLKYFGRFSIAVNTTTTYTWIIDDDVIPGEEWLANCVHKCSALNSIITCTGRLIPKHDFRPESWKLGNSYKHFLGDEKKGGQMNYCADDTEVDYACNSYFFKSSWMKAFWSIWPITFLSGEDIHLSASCKTKLNISTVVLKQTGSQDSGNIKRPYGWDNNASWKKNNFLSLREEVLKYHIKQHNWMPILWKDAPG